jgi:hypothetical protein
MSNMQVAKTILEQLGGGRFLVMTGAKNLVGSHDALTMKLPSNLTKGRITHLRVTLTAADDYTVETFRIRGAQPVVKAGRADGVYCDMLQDTFLSMTGLYTRF